MKTFVKIYLIVVITTFVFGIFYMFTPTTAIGQTEYTPLVELPGATDNGSPTLPVYLKGMYQLGVGLAAVLSVVMIVIGGIQYMSTDAVSGKSEGKDRIRNALLGLLLALLSFLILYTINPDLVCFKGINKLGGTDCTQNNPTVRQGQQVQNPQFGIPFTGSNTNNPSLNP